MKPSATTFKLRRDTSESRNGDTLLAARRRTSRIKFGDVVVVVPKVRDFEIRQNIILSSEALARANSVIAKAGVSLGRKKDIPLFFADKQKPGVFIRKLNGTLEHGVLKDGQFKVLPDYGKHNDGTT